VISYFLFTVFFLIANRNEILSSEYLVLGLALSLFAISIVLDAADLDDFERLDTFFWEQFLLFLEDAFKFLGIATWLVYFARYASQKIRALPRT
jgi:hypothetical protein